MKAYLSIILFLFSAQLNAAVDEFYSAHGYISDVSDEINAITYELVIPSELKKPAEDETIEIFDGKLTKEFKARYERKFGRTDSEQNYYQPNRFEEVELQTGVFVTVEEDQQEQRLFGEYMTKRLIEYHLDNYMKSSPELKTVHQIKERVSNFKVKSKQGYQFKFHYSISGNFIHLDLDNPLRLKTRVTLQMEQTGFGPGKTEEIVYSLGYDLSKKLNLRTFYKQEDGIVSLVGTRKISRGVRSTLTASTFVHEKGSSTREDLFLLGLSITH